MCAGVGEREKMDCSHRDRAHFAQLVQKNDQI